MSQASAPADSPTNAATAVAPTRGPRRALVAVTLAAALVASACTGAPPPGGTNVAAGSPDDVAEVDGDDTPRTAKERKAARAARRAGGGGTNGTASGGSSGSTGSDGQSASGGTDSGSVDQGSSNNGPRLGAGANDFVSTLFRPDEDRIGFTDDEIRLCAHAALTYGAAFNTTDEDLNVYWTAVNDAGGVYGRKVTTSYENDNYNPDTAVQAATACAEKDIFMLLGGIGFDQIPKVREWAERNRMLYFHHTATVKGSEGKQFSFTGLPTTEKMGEMFAELAATKFKGKKIGIVKRNSENWEPGIEGFKRVAAKHGVKIVAEKQVQVNARNYVQEAIDIKNSGAEVVFVWLNALESTEFITQARGQQWKPHFMVFPFNLTAQTLDDDALDPPISGVAMFNAFSLGDRSGEFKKYADDLKQFENQYAKYKPSVDIGGVGGDLLFLNWSAQKSFHQLLIKCGPDCSRNRLLETIHDFNAVTNSSACRLDFSRSGPDANHRGGYRVSIMETYKSPSGKVNFRNTHTCIEHLL